MDAERIFAEAMDVDQAAAFERAFDLEPGSAIEHAPAMSGEAFLAEIGPRIVALMVASNGSPSPVVALLWDAFLFATGVAQPAGHTITPGVIAPGYAELDVQRDEYGPTPWALAQRQQFQGPALEHRVAPAPVGSPYYDATDPADCDPGDCTTHRPELAAGAFLAPGEEPF